MSEPILKALMQLFALISDIHDDTVVTSRGKDIVRLFLARHLNNEQVAIYMKMFENFLDLHNSEGILRDSLKDRKRTSLNAVRILAICERINEELQQKQKVYVLVKLIDYVSSGEEISEKELDFLLTVANAFNIAEDEYDDIKSFIFNSLPDISMKNRLLVIDNGKEHKDKEIRYLSDENIRGTLFFLFIQGTNTYLFRCSGNEDIYLNGQNISPGETYVFENGSSVRGSGINTIYYTQVVRLITEKEYEYKITIDANDVTYKFRNSENGIRKLDFHEESGRLVGIIGSSGVGKSTSLSILSGSLRPDSGTVHINGHNLFDPDEKKHLQGVIGFVPQDDLLIEELTVFQNLWYNARMCLSNLPENEIREIVDRTLNDFDLDEIRDLKVGNPLNKVISGGQRKRVNIALELIREPTILFVDEPTSGLSSVDSETVMKLLKDQTYKGKLVIINIHQPGSDIYKMFDRIMVIDKGGYQIYYGDPSEAIVYFKTRSFHANPDEDQCSKCGNVNTDQILQIIEARVMDEHGKPTVVRKVSPDEWAEKFRDNKTSPGENTNIEKHALPENNFSIPGLAKQSAIFFTRDLLSKLADRQYILIMFLSSPVLAFLLAFFTKYTGGSAYRFSENDNIPAYLFMCVITSLFLGLIISSEEIIKDRKILKRESFLSLSWFSYINAKILIMFLVSAIQTISFILIGNCILEIRGMTLSYWLILFSTSCLANLIGLNISSALNSVIAVYIIIPFILIPQLLFSGVLVKFDQLHTGRNFSREFVPVIGELMPARWSFEALATEQFKNNRFEKHFFNYKMVESQNTWYGSFLIDKLKLKLWECGKYRDNDEYREIIADNFVKLNYYLDKLSLMTGFSTGAWRTSLNETDFDSVTEKEALSHLELLKRKFLQIKNDATALRDSVSKGLVSAMGIEEYLKLQSSYENKRLKEIVLDMNSPDKTYETRNKIIQKYEPAYMKAVSKYGRAHFYAPYKMAGSKEIDTYWFNLMVLWVITFIFYIALYFTALKKLAAIGESFSLKQTD